MNLAQSMAATHGSCLPEGPQSCFEAEAMGAWVILVLVVIWGLIVYAGVRIIMRHQERKE